MGDGILCEFPSAVHAVACAVAIQRDVAERERDVSEAERIRFRIGINVGDVVHEDGDILGDGVNVAARLQALAEPGGVCIARNVHSQVKDKLAFRFEPAGRHRVKNIAEPIEVWRVAPGEVAPRSPGRGWQRPHRAVAVAAAILLLVVAAGAGGWWWHQARSPATTAGPPLPDKPSVAVLPFDNLSGDPGQEYFSDGVTEDVITALSRFGDLFVVARNSVMPYKGKPADVRQVGRELGVRYVLEGSMQRAGDRLRITAQLIDAATGGHVWSERWDREAADLFAVQDEIAARIAGSVGSIGGGRGVLRQAELGRARRATPEQLEAYDLFLQGIEAIDRYEKEHNTRARALFERALVLDPSYAKAWAKLAFSHLIDYQARWADDPTAALRNGTEAARKAVEVDPYSGWAHWALANAHIMAGQLEEGLAEFELAVAANPNDADVLVDYGWALTFAGHAEEAVERIERGVRLNPLPPSWYMENLGTAYFVKGDYEAAVRTFSRASPDFPPNRLHLAASHAMLGREAEARAEVETALRQSPTLTIANFLESRPFRPADRERLAGSLRKAGLPQSPTDKGEVSQR
jgi:adenylate cyclase